MVTTGGLGWKYERILDTVSHHPCSDKTHLTGFVEDDDLVVLLSLADFLVYPSILEGFGLPILEAMACGTPIITSNVSSMPESAGDAALLVDPYSVVSMSEGIAELGGDALYRKELSEKGIRRARCFSWKQTALKTLEVYRKVIAG